MHYLLKYLITLICLSTLSGIVMANKLSLVTKPSNSDPNKVTLSVDMIGYNAAKGELTSRITAKLPAIYVESNSMVNADYLLIEKNTVGNSLLKIRKGMPFEAYNNTITLTHMVTSAGVQWLYPFDEHTAKIKVYFVKQTGPHDTQIQAMPTTIDCKECFFDGFDLDIKQAELPDMSQELTIVVERSMPREIFIIFINLMMLAVSSFILIMAIKIMRSPYKADISSLGFIGGLLFALPAIRNLQPNVPPIGILIDYLAFFEAEILIASSLIIVIIAWLAKPNKEE